MPRQQLSDLTDGLLKGAFDDGSWLRGVAYAREGRVLITDSGIGTIDGRVRGSGHHLYVCHFTWQNSPDGTSVSDRCTCPLGGACKHVVALVLTARGADDTRPAEPEVAPWRARLAPVIALAEAGGTAGTTPIALRFEPWVREPGWWDRQQVDHLELRVQPVVPGKRERWIKSGVTWRALVGQGHRPAHLDPDHVAALETMASGARYPSAFDSGPASLEVFGQRGWPRLRAAAEAGVALLDIDDRTGRVVIEPEVAEYSLDARRLPGGDVLVSATVRIGEQAAPLPSNVGGLIGDAAAFVIDGDEVIHLAGFARPLSSAVAALGRMDPLLVPEAEVDDFLQLAGSAVARIVPITSDDPGLRAVPPEPPSLVLVVDFDTALTARVRWCVRYPDRDGLEPLTFVRGRRRDAVAERALVTSLRLNELPALGDRLATFAGQPVDAAITDTDVIALVDEVLPWLVERGVDIRTDKAPEIREAEAAPVVTLTVSDDPKNRDWYDLGVTVTIDGEHIVFAALFSALTRGETRLLLPSGTWLSLDRPELDQLRRLIDEARGLADAATEPDRLRVNRFQAQWWDEFAQLGVIERQSQRWAEAMSQMGSMAEPAPVPVPSTLKAALRDYQHEGFSWLAFLHAHGLGGILADDMGLGKTVQALTLFAHVRETKPDVRFLVVAPTSVVTNWRHEAERFTPDLPVAAITETASRRRSTVAEAIGDAAIVVTSYTLLRLEFEQYDEFDWEIVILDEAQFVKNRQAKTYQSVRTLAATSKFAITGTPMENSLMDLWSMLSITAPGLYPDPTKFADVFAKPIESGRHPELLATVRRRISPLMRRRTKEQVLAELPPKTEQVIEVDLSPKHQKIYQTRLQRERQKVLGLAEDMDANRFLIFRSLTMLRQLALDPELVDDEYAGVGSAKLDHLVDQLVEIAAEGHRALVFSQFTRFLAKVKQRLDAAGIAYAYLDGRTRNRGAAIEEFTGGDTPVFLISLKAGGFGLNLTEADYCFLLDPWWNPAAENQAIDRAHRIGQQRPVMVYRYVSAGTIEEKVMELKARKQALFDTVIGDDEGALAGALTADDVRGLFS